MHNFNINNPASPPVSVVSLSYNRCANVLELMAALKIQNYPNFEVILVDNNSTDGTVKAVMAQYPQVTIHRCSQNFGMVSYNFGLNKAKGKYILTIDDDGLPASFHWISRIVDKFEAAPRLGAAACTIRMRDTGQLAYDNPQFIPHNEPSTGFECAAYNGTGAGLRAAALRQVGNYPFYFFRSFLELHMCTRLIEAGWQVHYFPHIEVWHSRASGSINRPVTYYGLRNYFWYVWTFYPWPYVLRETLRYLGYCLKLVLKSHLSVYLLGKTWFDLCAGWMRISSHRHPVSPETIAYLHRIRKYDNHCGIVPRHRPFVSTTESISSCT